MTSGAGLVKAADVVLGILLGKALLLQLPMLLLLMLIRWEVGSREAWVSGAGPKVKPSTRLLGCHVTAAVVLGGGELIGADFCCCWCCGCV